MPQYFSFNPTEPNPSHVLENATQPNQTHGWTQPMSISAAALVAAMPYTHAHPQQQRRPAARCVA